MPTIDRNTITHLAFEGGGGKGVVYLGVIRALEEVFFQASAKAVSSTLSTYPNTYPFEYVRPYKQPARPDKVLPLFPIWNSHPKFRQLKGIAGASAGAITAFFLAMGMSSEELEMEMNSITKAKLAGHVVSASEFELFFEDPQPGVSRQFAAEGNVQRLPVQNEFVTPVLNKILPLWGVPGLFIRAFIESIAGEDPIAAYLVKDFYHYDFVLRRIILSDFELRSVNKSLTEVEFWNQAIPPKPARNPLETITAPQYVKRVQYPRLLSYLYSLAFDRGLFSGLAVRAYFASKLKKYIFDLALTYGKKALIPVHNDPGKITFAEFFRITGVDLVLMGVNVVQNVPVTFSLRHTPDLPVIDAVGASMSIPFLFKPLIIKDRVNKSAHENAVENLKYYGMIVDGGMLTNYPIRAFDNLVSGTCHYWDNPLEVMKIQGDPGVKTFRKSTLGFRLQEGDNQGLMSTIPPQDFLPFRYKNDVMININPKPFEIPAKGFLGQLFNSFSYPAEQGQVAADEVQDRTVIIATGKIELTDFSSVNLDKIRGKKILSEYKVGLIKNAKKSTREAFGLQ